MVQTALTERYRDLGFRVVEGGKSNKLAILRTPAVAEIFGLQHKHVLDSIREQQEILSRKFGQGFAEHCRSSTYRARDGKDQPCFELTKVGFATVATKYDPTLRFLLALAFDALERADEAAQTIVLGQINKQISELRSQATGQNELVVHIRHEPLPKPDDKCERREFAREQERSRKTIEQLRLFGAQGRFAFGPPPIKKIADDADDAIARHIWMDGQSTPVQKTGALEYEFSTDREGDAICEIMRRNDLDGDPMILRFVRNGAPTSTGLRVAEPRGKPKQVLICVSHTIPLAIVLRAYTRLGLGPMSDIGLATLRHFLAF